LGDHRGFRDEKVVQTSKQAKEYLLCEKCEQRLSRDERYVAGLAYQLDGTLGLAIEPGAVFSVPHPRGPHSRRASIAGKDCLSIARFAASIFWRGHVARKDPLVGLKLWNPQAEALRRFVLGGKLPYRMCLHLVVLTDGAKTETVHSTLTIAPHTSKGGDEGYHHFVVAGLVFYLSMGTDWASGICLACSRDPHVIFQDWRSVRFVTNASMRMLLWSRHRT
jgi:hypothetical protein